MAATSSDAAVRRMGPWWRRLHATGGWYIWVIFLLSYLPLALGDVRYWPLAAIALAVLPLRIAGRHGVAR